jgi:hypothetical protein
MKQKYMQSPPRVAAGEVLRREPLPLLRWWSQLRPGLQLAWLDARPADPPLATVVKKQ